ncbi:phospholipid carrier-dependent glycosyltransferase [Zhihengliuella alba]|uniref:Polyprenol-phosphate-mannose--protein mannosyltransferase n=1 Tax=Zhihengliuella alba TaxID=547018 RepID=A0ABP7D657_9MICC
MRSWIAPPEEKATAEALQRRLLGRPTHGRGTAHGRGTGTRRRPSDRVRAGSARLSGWLLHHAVWLLPVLITALAAWLRLAHLAQPHDLTFDETYYVKDAFTLLQSGYERQWPEEGADEQFLAGEPQPLGEASYVVHPPLGKWLIGLGMLVFGTDNGLGWRFAAAVAGTLSVPLVYLVGRRLLGSTALAASAALLTAVDGHHIVMSRTALLDIFLMLFVLAAFYALLRDREDGRRRLAAALARADRIDRRDTRRRAPDDSPGAGSASTARSRGRLPEPPFLYGPWLLWRPWRLVAGLLLGAAVGVKWSALAFVAVFGLMTVLWDVGARRAAGIRHWLAAGLLREGIPAFLTIVPAAAAAYLASWSGWLAAPGGYDRQWAAEHPEEAWPLVPDAVRSLIEYHRSAFEFHGGLDSDHSWESGPETWLVAGRPVLFHFETVDGGQGACRFDSCTYVITDLPNPVLWWTAALAVLVVLLYWAGRRDWRAGAILSGIAAGFVPWWFFPDRTMFFFYTIAFHPFLMLAVAYVIGLMLNPSASRAPATGGVSGGRPVGLEQRRVGLAVVGVYLALVLAVSAFFLPVWTGQPMGPEGWHLRLWLPSWG